MKNWPLITTVIAVFVFALTPVGWELIAGVMSGEALSRNIAGPILGMAALILLAAGFIEWLMWRKINSRPNFPPVAQTTISD
jgi:hypothetical protein